MNTNKAQLANVDGLVERIRAIDSEAEAYLALEEIADTITTLRSELGEMRETLERTGDAIRRARAMVPDEEEGLAAQVFACHLNAAEIEIIDTLSRVSNDTTVSEMGK